MKYKVNTNNTYISFIGQKWANVIRVNFKACTLGQNDHFWKVVIYNEFVYHVAPVMPCSDYFCHVDRISNFANMIFANYMHLILIL